MSSTVGWKRFGAAWIAAATTLLAACGGGGGSDGNTGLGGAMGGGTASSPVSGIQKEKGTQEELPLLPLKQRVDGPLQDARFVGPMRMTTDSLGNTYVVDQLVITEYGSTVNIIRKIDSRGNVTTLKAAEKDGGMLQFERIADIAVDSQGTLYVPSEHAIKKIDARGNVSVFAGKPGEPGEQDGAAGEGRLAWPSSIAVDADGAVYVSSSMARTIRKISPEGKITTIAGSSKDGRTWRQRPGGDDGDGLDARFVDPTSLAVDGKKNVYVFDFGRVRKIAPNGAVSTLAGPPAFSTWKRYADGLGEQAIFGFAESAMAADADGTVYVADRENNVVRKISPAGMVTTIGKRYNLQAQNEDGTLTPPKLTSYYEDGASSSAVFENLVGITIRAGMVYVSEISSATIRQISADGVVSTWAGVRSRSPEYPEYPGTIPP
ncbi:hypothetical protein NU688_28525 [Variovorax sp. ZS18.2.2]|uniref:hypothetical protein n=1 Tax=Variovorax sp. ZS18.2.2 TaxID=2971255 RepID=UPI00215163B8|nr:hypothetical protein [Variovorax sp. ZS18.2.2]MCR6480133.1 hypothetical protein [Variovorax sp. ZS18.2.2]